MCIVPNCHANQGSKIACAQAGCPVCLEALLVEHKKLIYVVIRRQYPGNCDYVDLIQEGWIGLWQAIEHFDTGRGCTFSTYAGRAIRNRIWNAVEQGWKADGWLEPERVGDSLAKLMVVWQQEQVRQALTEELACLPERLGQVIRLAYGLDGQPPLTLAAIGR